MKNKNFQYYITKFFSEYLPYHTGYSKNTIQSYRDTFVIFLKYCEDIKKINSSKLSFEKISKYAIEEFLMWLENEKKVSISTRNQRLAALKSFFKYVQIEAIEYYELCTEISLIKSKKSPCPEITYLTLNGIKILLEQPQSNSKSGLRDLAILITLYDTGARVQELIDLKLENIRLKEPATIQLTGKGRKTRIVPITKQTAEILKKYIKSQQLDINKNEQILFFNKNRKPLSREGITYILNKNVKLAKQKDKIEFSKTITPHILRHSKAMHLLEANINLIYIRDFLGHESVETTQIYAKANPEIKRRFIEEAGKAVIIEEKYSKEEKANLIDWLKQNI